MSDDVPGDGPADGRKESTFLVTHADADSVVLKDVLDGQVHTLEGNPGVEQRDVLEATLAPVAPMEVTWRVVEVAGRRSLAVVESEESPTSRAREVAAEHHEGEVVRRERAGEGELHVLVVPPERTAEAVADVLDDEATLARAARLGVGRVEVRSTEGVVSVRYLP